MRNMLVAKRYSKALLGIISQKDEKEFLKEIKLLKKIVTKDCDFMDFINSKIIKSSKKMEMFDFVASKFSNYHIWKELFLILLEKKRQSVLPQIIEILEEEILNNMGIAKIKLIIAKKHNDDIIDKISRYIENFLNKD